MSISSTATLPLPSATPHLRAVRSVAPNPERRHPGPGPQRPAGQPGSVPPAAAGPSVSPAASGPAPVVPSLPPQALLAALPEGAAVVAALPQGSLPQALLAQYGAQFGASAGQPMVGYLVLVPAEAGAAPTGFPVASVAAPAPAPATAAGAPGGPSSGVPFGSAPFGPAPTVPAASVSAAPAAGIPVRPVRPAGRGIAVDVERRNAYVDGRLLDLTYLEFELLAHLTEHPQRVHTRDHLVSAVWGYGHVGDGRTVDVHVARLRRKLGVAYRDAIVTVRRVGYKYTPVA
ncbi:winged helix-turn-helix domain-containing protein [Kitasatospora sp. NPDC057500]|uniref:winged helix-turn-helix domain-containing protein n=1 Tax=Kitasatospora sp. NPDC057500 TaxID=3346151 RepID=UPI0036A57A43